MKKTEIEVNKMEQIVGGSQEQLDAFTALAYEKGYQTNNGLAGRMAATNMYKAVGMQDVNWHVSTGEPAVFIDNGGGEHSFEEVYEKMKALPKKN